MLDDKAHFGRFDGRRIGDFGSPGQVKGRAVSPACDPTGEDLPTGTPARKTQRLNIAENGIAENRVRGKCEAQVDLKCRGSG
jgi:hypothetical protein